MQEAPPWKAALCMAWSSTALGVPRSARERLDCQHPGVNLPPILTAKEFGSELEIVRPRLCLESLCSPACVLPWTWLLKAISNTAENRHDASRQRFWVSPG